MCRGFKSLLRYQEFAETIENTQISGKAPRLPLCGCARAAFIRIHATWSERDMLSA